MSAVEVLRLARENGIRVVVAGANLILDAEQQPEPAVLEAIRRHKEGIVTLLGADHCGWTAEDWRALFDERAGIAEFDGRQLRVQAEAKAFECCVVEWLNRHPCQSDPGRCAACGNPDEDGHTVVPFGAVAHGHTWLHPECWEEWHQNRRTEAILALKSVGIVAPTSVQTENQTGRDVWRIICPGYRQPELFRPWDWLGVESADGGHTDSFGRRSTPCSRLRDQAVAVWELVPKEDQVNEV